ncbi:MAG: prepilin-type N-terminal cleavage/methylation domain-containing protein [Acidobacteriota bacterium]
MSRKTVPAPKGEKGSSLIEVLIALLILFFLMIGVLQMFAMAYLVNLGSAARTEMTYKCQQVTENLRYLRFLQRKGKVLSNTGINFAVGTYNLPYTASELSGSFWGPALANVVEAPDGPFRLSVTIADGDAAGEPGMWIVTATATPVLTPGLRRYRGVGLNSKRVDYVAHIQK